MVVFVSCGSFNNCVVVSWWGPRRFSESSLYAHPIRSMPVSFTQVNVHLQHSYGQAMMLRNKMPSSMMVAPLASEARICAIPTPSR